MLDLHECKAEREQIQKVAEAEARIRTAISKQRQAVAEQRGDLEAQLAEAEKALEQQKQEAEKVKAQAAAVRAEASRCEAEAGLSGSWPEVEQADAAVQATEEKITETRRQVLDRAAREQCEVEEIRSLYQVYCAATGVRWFPQAECVEGYVALDGAVRAFEVGPSEAADPVAAADSLWETIEACLPTDAQPMQVVDKLASGRGAAKKPSRPSLTGLEDPEEEAHDDLYYDPEEEEEQELHYER